MDTVKDERQRLIGKIAEGLQAWARLAGLLRGAKAQHRRETDGRDLHRHHDIGQNSARHQALTLLGDPAFIGSDSNLIRPILIGPR